MSKSKFAFFAAIALVAGLASAQSVEANCYRGERVSVLVNGVQQTGTKILCANQTSIELDPSPVAQYYLPQVVVAPRPVYVVPQQVVVAPAPVYPSQVYLGRHGVSVSVPVYVNSGRPFHYYYGGYRGY